MDGDLLERVLDQQNLYKQTLASKCQRETSEQHSGGLTAPSGWCRLVWRRRRRMEVMMKQRPGGSDPFINRSAEQNVFQPPSHLPTCRQRRGTLGGGRGGVSSLSCRRRSLPSGAV